VASTRPRKGPGIPDQFALPPRAKSALDQSLKDWRRGWDSNPRYGFPYTRFPSVRLKPLGHLSTWKIGRQYSGRVPGYNPRSRPAVREIPEALLAPQPFDLAGIPIDGTATASIATGCGGTIPGGFRCSGRPRKRRRRRTSWVVGYCYGSSEFRSRSLF
jgi:hypothetical protein